MPFTIVLLKKIDIGPNVTEVAVSSFGLTKNLKVLDLSKANITRIEGFGQPLPMRWIGLFQYSAVEYFIIPDTFVELSRILSQRTLRTFTFKKSINTSLYISNNYVISDSIYSENDDIKIINESAFFYDEYHNPTILYKVPIRPFHLFTNKITKIDSSAFYGHGNSFFAFKSENIYFSNDHHGINAVAVPTLKVHKDSLISNAFISNLYIVSNSKNPPSAWVGPKSKNFYYCGITLLNTSIINPKVEMTKHTLSNYPHEYFLGDKNFKKDVDPEICA